MRNQTRLKPFDVKSILTYNIDGMVFCFIENYVFPREPDNNNYYDNIIVVKNIPIPGTVFIHL